MSHATPPKSIWTRLRDYYQTLALPARLSIVAAAAFTAALLGYWNLTASKHRWVYLLGGQEFSDSQLLAFGQAFQAEGLTSFHGEGARLRIPREKAAEYTAALAKRELLPASFYAAFDKAAEQTSWWTSSIQEDRRWELARAKFLAQVIEQMPEVETASVLIDRASARGLRGTADIRGTVTVKPRNGREIPPFRILQIRNLVAGAVANLPADSVTVVDLNGKSLLELGAPRGDDLLERIKEFEEHYGQKIRAILAYIPDVMVTVNVELDTTRQRRTEQVVIADNLEMAADDPLHAQDAHAASVSANTAMELDAGAESAPAPPQTPEPRATQQQTWEEHIALAPKNVTVAVSIPQDIAERLAASPGDPTLSTESWSAAIRDQVTHAIPAGVSTKIKVQSYPRKPAAEPLAAVATPPPAVYSGWTPWIVATSLAATLMLLLGAGGLRRHQGRATPAYAGSAEPPGARSLAAALRDAATGEHRQELVRIERTSAQRRGPHLAQVAVTGFEDLRRLAPGSLQAVFEAVESRLWAPALRGASVELCERILTHIPSAAATLLRDEMAYLGPVRLGDVEAAQHEILEVVRRLDHTGDLILEDREEAGRERNDHV